MNNFNRIPEEFFSTFFGESKRRVDFPNSTPICKHFAPFLAYFLTFFPIFEGKPTGIARSHCRRQLIA
jgi:hypothetical protein